MKILLDGSNVLYWRGGHPDAQAPLMVLRALIARRYSPVVYFDHSIHLHLTDDDLERLDQSGQFYIAPRGTQADVLLLDACGNGRTQIVSADGFKDWRRDYPLLRRDWLVNGRIGKGGRVSFSKKMRPAPL
jgi:hypothetical protein